MDTTMPRGWEKSLGPSEQMEKVWHVCQGKPPRWVAPEPRGERASRRAPPANKEILRRSKSFLGPNVSGETGWHAGAVGCSGLARTDGQLCNK